MGATAQRLALAAWGGRVDSSSKRDKAQSQKKLKKRGAYPKSGARIVSWRFYLSGSLVLGFGLIVKPLHNLLA